MQFQTIVRSGMRIPFAALLLCLPVSAETIPKNLGAAEYYRPPQLTLMVGFIKDPQHKGFSVKEWSVGIGTKFDAVRLVERCQRAGVAQIIWYDKWIDGLVFRKTKTTTYRTERDFLADLAPECRKRGIKLAIYFNTYYDGNPEFAQWAVTDQRGKPIPFSPFWPENLLSMYSPFREKVLEQIRELFVEYDVDGIWLDVPGYATLSYDRWTREVFRKRTGKEMDLATLEERRRFAMESSIEWNREVAAFVRKIKPSATVTTNEFVDPVVTGPARSSGMAQPVDYFSTELHTTEQQIKFTAVLRDSTKPFEVGTLISDDWFTPLNSGPLKSSKSPDQMHNELATVFSAGLNLYMAVALAHDGTTHERTMQLLDMAGEWLKDRRPFLAGAEDVADVAILLGTPDANSMEWPGGGENYNDELLKLEDNLRSAGYLPRRLQTVPHCRSYVGIPEGARTVIVPDRAQLTAAERAALERFVRAGGKLIAMGRGASLTPAMEPVSAAPQFGVEGSGYATKGGFTVGWAKTDATLPGPLLHVRPTSAEPMLWAFEGRSGEMPFVTRNRVGSGEAWLVATPESSLAGNAEISRHLWKEAIGEPVWSIDGSANRYLVRFRRQKDRHVLHVIDNLLASEGPMQRYRPLYTTIRINSKLVSFDRATVVPDNRELKVATEGIWKIIEIFPDPELTITLR